MIVHTKPILFFDCETTGIHPETDRIIELAVMIRKPNGECSAKTWKFNPGIRIPAAATAVHGITDKDVAGYSRFADHAQDIRTEFEGKFLSGFNSRRYDLPLLNAELVRAGTDPLPDDQMLDVMTLYHKLQPRNLETAYLYYTGNLLEGAHTAITDVQATIDILEAMTVQENDLPHDIDDLIAFVHPPDPDAIDKAGKFRFIDDMACMAFGKHMGVPIEEMVTSNAGYLHWMLVKDFSQDTCMWIERFLAGDIPVKKT